MPHFTAKNAAMYAKKGNEIRWSEESRESHKNSKIIAAQEELTKSLANASESFREMTLNRVRRQIKLLLDKIDCTLDRRNIEAKEMQELTNALFKLEAVEQKLSGRAAPGTLRPTSKSNKYPEVVPRFSVIHEDEPEPATPVVTNVPQNVPQCSTDVPQPPIVASSVEQLTQETARVDDNSQSISGDWTQVLF